MGSLLLKALSSYLEAHPDQVASLIGEGVQAATHALQKHNATQKAAAAA